MHIFQLSLDFVSKRVSGVRAVYVVHVFQLSLDFVSRRLASAARERALIASFNYLLISS